MFVSDVQMRARRKKSMRRSDGCKMWRGVWPVLIKCSNSCRGILPVRVKRSNSCRGALSDVQRRACGTSNCANMTCNMLQLKHIV